MFESYKDTAIDSILSYFGKDNVESSIAALRPSTENDKYELHYRPNSKVKLLFSIPFEEVALISNSIEDEEDTEEDVDDDQDGNSTSVSVTFAAEDFNASSFATFTISCLPP